MDPPETARIGAVLQEAGIAPAGQRVRVVAARPLAEAPGRRRVVRYDVEGLVPGRTVALIGKTYVHRHRASLAHLNLRLLHDEVFAPSARLAVPAPVGAVPELRMTLYREVTGRPLDRLPEAAAVATARLAAEWLATLHASDTVLPRRLDLGHEVGEVQEWASRVARLLPGAGDAAHALADRLAAVAAALPPVREVPVHKDFHAGHVLAVGTPPGGDGGSAVPTCVVVIDLDEARMGDPALDLAHVVAYLDASSWHGAGAAREAFLSGYGPLPGPAPALRWAFFTAHTCMKMAKQLATGRGPLRAGPDVVPAVLAVLRKGATCLDG
jgi:aminoglycoside phosphotransferase (APT) family kinase protein